MASKRAHDSMENRITLGPFTERTCLLLPQHEKDGFLKFTVLSRDASIDSTFLPVVAAIPSTFLVETLQHRSI